MILSPLAYARGLLFAPNHLQGALKKQAYNKVVQQERMWVMIPYLLCCWDGEYRRRSRYVTVLIIFKVLAKNTHIIR